MPSTSATPTLPPNVSIFSPANPATAKALLQGRLFTRITTSAGTEAARLARALEQHAPGGRGHFLTHKNVVLIFDGAGAGQQAADVEGAHHEHFRLVCLALKEADIGIDVAGCVFDSPEVSQAGFQLDTLSSGSVLVIDLMGGEDDDDSDDGADGLAGRAKGDMGATLS
ncbi:hypothetical protein PpBr36_06889 [Pyricularia pennisetigena]|uniref:hypothetical protein n=1 Tax=Pyricularia pennisetigena TaxID=1578925 RepID=UPI001154EA5A|nr:hypothetical protein PpBr36_06889 [Pyricularia pennisetigena]TLS26073.1 hypothetical protein PpBr36_06889 [Pyricularia pennisetigena]